MFLLTAWARRTQQAACRNAMAASTAMSAQRRERDEVAAYVETVVAHRTGVPVGAVGPVDTQRRTSALG